MKCYIQLSKIGDIISILPILYHEWQATGEKPVLMVCRDFASILDGVSYVQPIIFNGAYDDLKKAIAQAKETFSQVVVLQTHGNIPIEQSTPSFQLDQWKRAGCVEHFNEWPTVFDKRNWTVEAAALAGLTDMTKYRKGDPIILFADHSQSSPFLHKEELYEMLRNAFPDCFILRLSSFRIALITHLLAFYDISVALVTIETAHLHLSKASQVPTFVLAANGWRGSAPHPKFKFFMRYNDWDQRKVALIDAVRATLAGEKPAAVKPATVSCVIPIYKPDAAMLLKCLAAVSPQVDEIIITREAGAMLPQEVLDEHNPKIKYTICPESNIGFGKNVNFGAKAATGDYLLVLNDDCFLAPDAVDKMKAVMADDVGLVGHFLTFPNGKIYHSGKTRNPNGGAGFIHIDGIGTQTHATIGYPCEMENVNGASWLFRRNVFDKVGGYDEGYKFYCEDDDLAMKVRQAGWKIWYTPFARGVHLSQSETSKVPGINKIMQASNARFASKWGLYFLRNAGNTLGNFDYLR